MGLNVENILKVADAIEQASVPGLGFNMGCLCDSHYYEDRSGRDCGTVACIAGTAVAVLLGMETLTDCGSVDDVATELLGLTRVGLFEGQAGELFFPENPADDVYTPVVAARCLRNLAITGKVDWAAAMKPNDPSLPAVPVKSHRALA